MPDVTTGVVLFTRDLRVHDQPALAEAARTFDRVVPLFVFDDTILARAFASSNKLRFLLDALADLDRALHGQLVKRRGDVADETLRVAREAEAGAIWLSADVSGYARRRERALRRAAASAGVEVRTFPGITLLPADAVRHDAADHYRVFTPFYRRWRTTPWRRLEPAPELRLASGLRGERDAEPPGAPSEDLAPGGETAARACMNAWLRQGLADYAERHDDLAADGTSRLSPYLHFGCLSPLELAARALDTGHAAAAEAFVRQLCWRDFFHQVLAATPAAAQQDYYPHGRWRHDARALDAWKQGRTGVPIVDAGMRQLRREGWMHNRARLLTASFLTRDLGLDWRDGADHFLALLADGDLANNQLNWQWVAGTGNDARRNRSFNPIRQALRFDAAGAYVRRYVPELASVAGKAIHEPWKLEPASRRALDYPEPLVDSHA